MGYYTDFKLTVIPDNIENIDSILEDNTGYYWDSSLELNAKWYEYDENMRKLSKLYPDHVFQLDGDGEERGDVWRIYYKDGKKQNAFARIAYDSFDENKLS